MDSIVTVKGKRPRSSIQTWVTAHALLLVMFVVSPHQIHAQGCSDAGVCTLETMQPLVADSAAAHPWRLGFTLAAIFYTSTDQASFPTTSATYFLPVFNPYVEYRLNLTRKLKMSGRINGGMRSGVVTTRLALSDVMITVSYQMTDRWNIWTGAKVPVQRANATYNDRHLPMIYQPGLGTLDVLGGFSWHSRRIQFALAIQHPVVQNKNSFDPGEWIDTPAVNALLRTTGFNRKPDLVGRLMMAQPIGSANGKGSWVFNYGFVPIYHAGNDTFIDHEENEVEIAASSGLTLNLSLGLQRTGKHFWHLSIGAPVIARDVRPEGLPQAGLVMEWGL